MMNQAHQGVAHLKVVDVRGGFFGGYITIDGWAVGVCLKSLRPLGHRLTGLSPGEMTSTRELRQLTDLGCDDYDRRGWL